MLFSALGALCLLFVQRPLQFHPYFEAAFYIRLLLREKRTCVGSRAPPPHPAIVLFRGALFVRLHCPRARGTPGRFRSRTPALHPSFTAMGGRVVTGAREELARREKLGGICAEALFFSDCE